jgi:hypothetical protein
LLVLMLFLLELVAVETRVRETLLHYRVHND